MTFSSCRSDKSAALPHFWEQQLRGSFQIVREPLQWNYEGGALHLDISMPPPAIAAITIDLAPKSPGELNRE